MRTILFLIATVFISQYLSAQEGSVSGVVSDVSGPIHFATVGFASVSSGSVTNDKGEFIIDHLDGGDLSTCRSGHWVIL